MITLVLAAGFIGVAAVVWLAAATRLAQTVSGLIPERGHDADCAACCSTCQASTHDRTCLSDVASL